MNYLDQFILWVYLSVKTAALLVSLNRELEVSFSSTHGLRQGCSVSPYRYVIINNALTKLLNNTALEGSIGFHPKCKEVNLTHLSVADDIMVFTNGRAHSLKGTLDVFEKFVRISGLCINVSKSTLFAAGRGK